MRELSSNLSAKVKQSLQTIGNNANPHMQVVVARAKSSIQDASYFTIEEIQTKPGLTDISIATRRRRVSGAPDGLFVINLDNGVAKTLFRAYPDTLKLGWTPQFSLYQAKAVAICFDGHWERYRQTWNLITEEVPYLFVVGMDNKLHTQIWNDTDTRIELATEVLKVKAVRGWKNAAFHDKDHGLVAAYIKTDGKVYYRNYCLQVTNEIIWEPERQLEEFIGTAININMFVTNDYRTAFIIEDNLGRTHWFITERNWAGMASPTDNLRSNISDLSFKVTPLQTYQIIPDSMDHIILDPPDGWKDYTPWVRRISDERLETAVSPLYVNVCPPVITLIPDLIAYERLEYEDNKTIKLIFNSEIVCNIPVLMNDLKITTGIGESIEVASIYQNDNSLLIRFKNKVDIMNTITVVLDKFGFYTIGARVNETCVIDYGKIINISIPGRPPQVNENLNISIDVMFDVSELTDVPRFMDEHLTAAVSELNFIVTEVSTTMQPYKDEQLTAGISNIIFTVTQIETSPV